MVELLLKDPKDYIYLEYESRRQRRPSYSMRALARDLKLSPSSLNDFLKDRVGMSEKRIENIAENLNWSELRKKHFMDLIIVKHNTDPAERQAAMMRINLRVKDKATYFNMDQFKMISQWFHLVIVELCCIQDNITPRKIVEQLGISLTEAKKALNQLSQLGILQKTPQGFKPTEQTLQFGDSVPSEAIRNFHLQILQQAEVALVEKDMSQRESHSLVFSIRSEDRAALNQELRKSIYSIVNKYAVRPNADSVQVISLQSFNPLKGSSTL